MMNTARADAMIIQKFPPVSAAFSILIVGGTAFYLLVPPMMDEFVWVKDLVIDYFSNGTHDGNEPQIDKDSRMMAGFRPVIFPMTRGTMNPS